MKIIQKIAIVILLLNVKSVISQETLFYNNEPGTINYLNSSPALKVADGNSTIATSYTNTACGLSYTQVSVFLSNKSFTFGPGIPQPAPLVVSGLPYCHSVLKAFLYVSTSGTGTPITATLTNPQNVTNSFSMAIIGQGADVCWGYGGSRSYRADVTSIVSGAGTYTLSGIPVTAAPGSDAQGATLFIIYKDVTQNYSGSIVMADGAAVSVGGTKTVNISGFNVCNTPILTTNFMLVSDLQRQGDANMGLNSFAYNYTLTAPNQQAYNFISDPGVPASIGQTTANYVMHTGGDCYNMVLAGMYYRTNCLTCTVAASTPPNTPTISITTSSNVICSGNSVTLTASGASTYSWSNGANTSSIVVSPTTTTTYWVYSNNINGCSNSLFTQSVSICSGLFENTINSNIKLYPNPSKGVFKIEVGSKIENSEVTIFNSIGQLVYRQSIKEGENVIDLQKLSVGYYYGVVTSKGEKVFGKKLIIE